MIQNHFNTEFNKLLGKTRPSRVALAVSGGVDSIAMLSLASVWSAESGIKLVVMNVDHNIRVSSQLEQNYVAQISKQLGYKFFPLSWNFDGNKIALQERARKGRYDLISRKCHDLGINTVLTAHHLDDMIETYLMRKAKKSGFLGLSSSNSFFYNNIRILRPLSKLHKIDLIDHLKRVKIKWIEDESNDLDLYERNRVRKYLTQFSDQERKELVKEIKEVDSKSKILNKEFIAILAQAVQFNNYGFAMLDINLIKKVNLDIKIQLFNYVLTIISGKTTLPRFRSVSKLLKSFDSTSRIDCSLHGCILKKTSGILLIFREKSAINTDSNKLKNIQYWDNRFELTIEHYSSSYQVGSLSNSEYIEIKGKLELGTLAKISDNNHKAILFTLPVIKNLEKVVAIPHISYYDDFDQGAKARVVFRPSFISRFTHFL